MKHNEPKYIVKFLNMCNRILFFVLAFMQFASASAFDHPSDDIWERRMQILVATTYQVFDLVVTDEEGDIIRSEALTTHDRNQAQTDAWSMLVTLVDTTKHTIHAQPGNGIASIMSAKDWETFERQRNAMFVCQRALNLYERERLKLHILTNFPKARVLFQRYELSMVDIEVHRTGGGQLDVDFSLKPLNPTAINIVNHDTYESLRGIIAEYFSSRFQLWTGHELQEFIDYIIYDDSEMHDVCQDFEEAL